MNFRLTRTNVFLLTAVTTGLGLLVQASVSSEAADKPAIEVVTHAGAGGGTDVNSRMMMLRSRRTLKQDMVVVNKRGGGGAAAMNYFITRPADGNTIMTFTVGHAITMAQHEIGVGFHLIGRVSNGNCKSRAIHRRQIGQIVADKHDLFFLKRPLFRDLLQGQPFVWCSFAVFRDTEFLSTL